MNDNNRMLYLDGLRALLVLVVILEHLVKFTAPYAAFTAVVFPQTLEGDFAIHLPPFNLLHNGAWAVSTFFVLSGYIITHVIKSKKVSVDALVFLGNRYIKFALMLVTSYALIYLIELFTNVSSTLTIYEGLKLSFYKVIFLHELSYNPVLWTLGFEMYGAIMMVIIALVHRYLVDKQCPKLLIRIFYLGFAVLLLNWSDIFYGQIMCLFILGGLLNYIRLSSRYRTIKIIKHIVVLILALAFISVDVRGGLGNEFILFNLSPNDYIYRYFINGIGGFFLLMSILNSSILQNALKADVLVMIGKASFSAYITHYIVISAVFKSDIATGNEVGFVVALTIMLIFLISWGFYSIFEVMSYNFLKVPFLGTSITADNKPNQVLRN